MMNWINELYNELLQRLQLSERQDDQKNISSDQKLQLIMETVSVLKQRLKTYEFSNQQEEIRFYKSELPDFFALHIYYTELFELETVNLIGTPRSKQKYLDKSFRKIEQFFNKNIEFYNYYRSGKTNLDKEYFLRDSDWNHSVIDILAPVVDPSFYTANSFKIATILAYSRLENYLQNPTIVKQSSVIDSTPLEEKLEWTDSKRDLTELIYSLKEQGSFNKGKADLKHIIDYFELIFSVRLGNTSSTFQEILSRKTGYTNFIDKLRDKLLKRIDTIEEKHIR